MTKKSEIGIFSLIILFVGMIFVPVVSAEKLSGGTNDNVIGISDSTPELKSIIEQIPPTDPSILNKMNETRLF